MSKNKSKFKPGDAIITNVRYAKIIGNKTPHEGTLVKRQTWRDGLWSVQMPPFKRPQLIHESMMEKKK